MIFFFLDKTPEAKETKAKTDEIMSNQKLLEAKEIINRGKRQLIEWDKTFTKHTSNKALTPKICKGTQLNSRKTNNPTNNGKNPK